jgi:hypothetical protein
LSSLAAAPLSSHLLYPLLAGVKPIARARDCFKPVWMQRLVEAVVLPRLLQRGGMWWDGRVVSKKLDGI